MLPKAAVEAGRTGVPMLLTPWEVLGIACFKDDQELDCKPEDKPGLSLMMHFGIAVRKEP